VHIFIVGIRSCIEELLLFESKSSLKILHLYVGNTRPDFQKEGLQLVRLLNVRTGIVALIRRSASP